MQKFFPENYKLAMRDIEKIFDMLNGVQLHALGTVGIENMKPSADGLLAAAVEIWKHQNPWVGAEYGEEPF